MEIFDGIVMKKILIVSIITTLACSNTTEPTIDGFMPNEQACARKLMSQYKTSSAGARDSLSRLYNVGMSYNATQKEILEFCVKFTGNIPLDWNEAIKAECVKSGGKVTGFNQCTYTNG